MLRAPLTVSVRPAVADHLRELAEAHGTTPGRIIESLVEREWSARSLVLAADSPWVVTERAIDDALPLLGGRFDRAQTRDVLESACVDAELAEREGRRKPATRRDGRLQYRGPKPHRFTLLVETDAGGKRSLVGVTRSG